MVASLFGARFALRSQLGLASFGLTLALVLALVANASGCTKSHSVNAVGLSLEDGGVEPDEVVPDAETEFDASVGNPDSGGGGACPSTCEALQTNPFITLERCCTSGNKCGVEIDQLMPGLCLEEDAPGAPDTDCPAVSLMGFINLPGCCRPDGTCGSLDSLIGLGCTLNINDQGNACGDSPD